VISKNKNYNLSCNASLKCEIEEEFLLLPPFSITNCHSFISDANLLQFFIAHVHVLRLKNETLKKFFSLVLCLAIKEAQVKIVGKEEKFSFVFLSRFVLFLLLSTLSLIVGIRKLNNSFLEWHLSFESSKNRHLQKKVHLEN
jgi:hypothetical protein